VRIETGTVASQYAKLGITLRCANTERVNGWAEVLHRLGDPSNGVPARLFFHERCARLIECLPSLQHDPNRPEDVLKVDPGWCWRRGCGGLFAVFGRHEGAQSDAEEAEGGWD
jgi:hypothetical protein